MDELKRNMKIEALNKKKRQLLLSLEWSILNNDKLLHDTTETELKAVLKNLRKLQNTTCKNKTSII